MKGLCYSLQLAIASPLILLQGITLHSIALTVNRKQSMLQFLSLLSPFVLFPSPFVLLLLPFVLLLSVTVSVASDTN